VKDKWRTVLKKKGNGAHSVKTVLTIIGESLLKAIHPIKKLKTDKVSS
jgi:hypothetical protein